MVMLFIVPCVAHFGLKDVIGQQALFKHFENPFAAALATVQVSDTTEA
jgi:hypothetical protein